MEICPSIAPSQYTISWYRPLVPNFPISPPPPSRTYQARKGWWETVHGLNPKVVIYLFFLSLPKEMIEHPIPTSSKTLNSFLHAASGATRTIVDSALKKPFASTRML